MILCVSRLKARKSTVHSERGVNLGIKVSPSFPLPSRSPVSGVQGLFACGVRQDPPGNLKRAGADPRNTRSWSLPSCHGGESAGELLLWPLCPRP